MAIVSVAIVMSFHLKSQPTKLELRMSLPLGLIFWLLSMACLASGFANYIRTVVRYSRRSALVQAGWKTEMVSHFDPDDNQYSNIYQVFTVVATAIVAVCVLFISTNATKSS
jgi:hypothetical protein